MKSSSGLSLLLLLVFGYSYGLLESMEDGDPWEKILLWKIAADGDKTIPAPLPHLPNPKDKKSTDPASLFSIAKELQGFGKERAGFRFRFGRRNFEDFEPQIDKRVGTDLGSLAEELNGYNRKKGGFSFRFGRR